MNLNLALTPKRTILLLVLIMAIPIVLSFTFFSYQSLRLDEAQSLWQTSRSVPEIFVIIATDVHVPLYHVLLHFWRLFLGNTVSVARAMSLAFYIASIPLLYLLGKKAYSKEIGLFVAFLFSISPFMNWYGNEIRMYTLFTFFVILNQYFFVKLFTDGKANDRIWAAYVITALLGVYAHYFFFLNLAAQAVFYFLRKDLFSTDSLRRFIMAAVVVVVAFLPWAWRVLHNGESGLTAPLLAVPTTVNLFSAFSQFVFGFQTDNINTVFLSLWPLSIILAFLTLRHETRRMQPETQYFMLTIIVSMAIAFGVSFVFRPLFVSRYLIFTVPSLYLLLASLFNNYAPRFAVISRFALAFLMIATLIVEIVSPTTPVKENYEQASQYLGQHATAQDVVIVSAPFTVYPMEYYYRGPATLVTLPVWDQYVHGGIPPYSAADLPNQVTSITNADQNAYLLLSYDQGYQKDIQDYFDNHFKRTYMQTFSPGLTLYVYTLRYDTSRTVASSTATK